ncbi:hypothetical protein F5Y15DRAFT_366445 [Xylariaceae sp. FL0016]|nr:hypothetical protein F5Y15DRAFT_366445 [Xylariaceae sp. FL0016]
MYAQQVFVAVLVAASATVTSARSIGSRQIFQDGLACNIARLQIVGALGDTKDSVGQIQDATVADAASTGLQMADDGISQIAQAIVAGEAPPDAGREMVEAGLTAAGKALTGGDSSDQAVVDAQESLADAKSAGQDVVAQC